MSYDEFLAGDQLTAQHVAELGLGDLVRVEFGKLADAALAAAASRLIGAHEWSHAERAVSAAAARGGTLADDLRDELVVHLLECNEIARAREHVAKLPPDLAKLFELELAIDQGIEPGWHALVGAARLAATDKLAAIDLAYTLLRAEPALGIVAARACIGAMHVDDPDILLELVEDARDRLNVPPEDPAWDVLEALTDKSKTKEPADDESKLRQSLAESAGRADELERKLAALRTELEQARTRPAAELIRAPEQRGALDDKVRALEALIREGNAERRELRKQLETAAATPEPSRRDGPRARRATIEEGDDDVGDDVEQGTRSIAIPRFERRAIDALREVPATVASETMRTIGTLSAGDGFAWRTVKQAKDMVRPVLMARVGIHHRVLFRVDDGALDVIDLITREQLLTTLKRLRANR